jgi:hypothetical protein
MGQQDFHFEVPTTSDATLFSKEGQLFAEVCCLTVFFSGNDHDPLRNKGLLCDEFGFWG